MTRGRFFVHVRESVNEKPVPWSCRVPLYPYVLQLKHMYEEARLSLSGSPLLANNYAPWNSRARDEMRYEDIFTYIKTYLSSSGWRQRITLSLVRTKISTRDVSRSPTRLRTHKAVQPDRCQDRNRRDKNARQLPSCHRPRMCRQNTPERWRWLAQLPCWVRWQRGAGRALHSSKAQHFLGERDFTLGSSWDMIFSPSQLLHNSILRFCR